MKFTKRVSANEIKIAKDENGDYVYHVISEGWGQPLEGRKVARRIIKNGELVISDDTSGDKTPQTDSSSSDSNEDNPHDKILRAKNNKKIKKKNVTPDEGAASVDGGGGAQRCRHSCIGGGEIPSRLLAPSARCAHSIAQQAAKRIMHAKRGS